MLKCSRRSERASLEERDVKRNLLRRCARAAGKLAEVRSSEEAVRAYQSLGWKGPCLMNPNRLSRAHAPGENPAHPLLKQSAPRSLPNQYAELKRLIKQRGLLDQQPAYFAGKSLLTLGLLAVGLTLLLILDNLWLQLLNAAYLAFVFVQISLLAHDFGHRQFSFRSPLEERLAHPHLRQPVARHKPPVVDRQAQRASRSPQPDGRRPRRRYSTARLRRRAGSREARARALRREIPGRPHIPPLAPAGDQHAPQQHRVPRREEGEEHAGRSPDDLRTLRAVLRLCCSRCWNLCRRCSSSPSIAGSSAPTWSRSSHPTTKPCPFWNATARWTSCADRC